MHDSGRFHVIFYFKLRIKCVKQRYARFEALFIWEFNDNTAYAYAYE